jgi:hypothetical protein
MNRRRIDMLERQFLQTVDDEPTLQDTIEEIRRCEKWLEEQGYPHDAHGAIAAGLRTPKEWRVYTLEIMAKADEQLAAWHWFVAWRHIAEKRQRIADPRFASAREHDSEVLDNLTKEAHQWRTKLQGWGIDLEAALRMARRIVCESGGNVTPVEEFNAIATVIRNAEAERVKQGSRGNILRNANQ